MLKLLMVFLKMLIVMVDFMQHLTGIKGLSEAKVDKICDAAEKIVVRANFVPCKNVHLCQLKMLSWFLMYAQCCFQNFGYITGSDALLKVSSQSNP